MFVPEAIILAGGLGTRLSSVVNDTPKSMALVNGRPFLEYLLDYLDVYDINHVVLSVGYKHQDILDHFGKQYKNIQLDYAIEEEPLGTGGGIKKAFDLINGNKALVFNGDTMFRIDLIRLFDFHSSRLSKFSLVLREVDDVSRYGSVEVDENRKVTAFNEKGEKSGKGLINGGVYLISKSFFHGYLVSLHIPDQPLEGTYIHKGESHLHTAPQPVPFRNPHKNPHSIGGWIHSNKEAAALASRSHQIPGSYLAEAIQPYK